jgi:hypothetical protein
MRAPPDSNGVYNFLGKVSSITKFKSVESGRRILQDYSAEGRKRRNEMFPYLMIAKNGDRG